MIAAALAVVIIPLAVVILFMTRTSNETFSFTIANGTKVALDAGRTPPSPIPLHLTVSVGDTLEMTNNDVATHTYAFLVLKPGETGRYTFHNAGTFTASCTVGKHSTITITVKE